MTTHEHMILVPSYRRAGEVRTIERYPDVVLAVQECEGDEYRQAYPSATLAIIPDTCKGNMARVRNWMLEFGYKHTERVVMMDDDLDYVGRYFKQKPENVDGLLVWGEGPPPVWYQKFDQAELHQFIEHGYDLAEEWGAYLWGCNVQSDPKFYREYTPFCQLAPVLGPFSAHRKNPLRYDERLSLNEDYDLVLQHWYKYGRVLRSNPHFYRAGHIDQPGGCASHRTLDAERRQADVMIRKWGAERVRYNFSRSTNPVLHPPMRGV